MKINLETFMHLVEEELALSIDTISPDAVFRDLPNWSSLNALLLISRINADCGVLLSSYDLSTCHCIRDIFNRINDHHE